MSPRQACLSLCFSVLKVEEQGQVIQGQEPEQEDNPEELACMTGSSMSSCCLPSLRCIAAMIYDKPRTCMCKSICSRCNVAYCYPKTYRLCCMRSWCLLLAAAAAAVDEVQQLCR